MIAEQQLKEEIARIHTEMATAADSQREYMIDSLAALWWVSGHYDRGTAFAQAYQAWDQVRPTAPTA